MGGVKAAIRPVTALHLGVHRLQEFDGPFFCETDNSNLVFFAGEASVPTNLAQRGLGLTSADVGRQKQELFDRPAQAVSIPILKL